MAGWGATAKSLLLGSALLLSCAPLAQAARADVGKSPKIRATVTLASFKASSRAVAHGRTAFIIPAVSTGHSRHAAIRVRNAGRANSAPGISCVPFARLASGIAVGGNAWQWWDNAAGQYARGNRPEVGSVLAFRSNTNMRLGHVAVVSKVINAREVAIDHANWPSTAMRGGVARNIAVVDVSEANDWSAVRVELGRSGSFGAVYPTYGFIYDRPDNGVIVASVQPPAPQPELNPVPRDLRPVAERPWRSFEEVAEAPDGPRRRIDLRLSQASGRPSRYR
jgi:hypothetical protein